MSTDYFIGVNQSEADRLRAQHEAWRPETESLWIDAGFRSCGSIIDFGCGPGFTSLDLAREIKSAGEICAVDKASGFLEYLAKQSHAHGVRNIKTVNADLTRPGTISGSFDAAFCRWFL